MRRAPTSQRLPPTSSTSTSRLTGDVLLVGSMPFETAEEAMRSAARRSAQTCPRCPTARPATASPGSASYRCGSSPHIPTSSRATARRPAGAARARRLRRRAPSGRRQPALDLPREARCHRSALRRPRLRAFRAGVLRPARGRRHPRRRALPGLPARRQQRDRRVLRRHEPVADGPRGVHRGDRAGHRAHARGHPAATS
jgi:hypothetical protein